MALYEREQTSPVSCLYNGRIKTGQTPALYFRGDRMMNTDNTQSRRPSTQIVLATDDRQAHMPHYQNVSAVAGPQARKPSGQIVLAAIGVCVAGMLSLNLMAIFARRAPSQSSAQHSQPAIRADVQASSGQPQAQPVSDSGEEREQSGQQLIATTDGSELAREDADPDSPPMSVYEQSLIYGCKTCDGIGKVYTVEGLSHGKLEVVVCPTCKGKGNTGHDNLRDVTDNTVMSFSEAQKSYLGRAAGLSSPEDDTSAPGPGYYSILAQKSEDNLDRMASGVYNRAYPSMQGPDIPYWKDQILNKRLFP
jgi:hypothetical protein